MIEPITGAHILPKHKQTGGGPRTLKSERSLDPEAKPADGGKAGGEE
jgi:hypothetical protein